MLKRGMVAVCATAVLGLVACGGSEKTPVAAAPVKDDKAPTAAEYVSELDAVCAEGNAKGTDLQEQAERMEQAGDTESALKLIRDEMLPLLDEYQGQVEALEVPSSEREFHDSYVDFNRRVHAITVTRLEQTERQGYVDSAIETEAQKLRAERNALVDGHGGFESCGENDDG